MNGHEVTACMYLLQDGTLRHKPASKRSALKVVCHGVKRLLTSPPHIHPGVVCSIHKVAEGLGMLGRAQAHHNSTHGPLM